MFTVALSAAAQRDRVQIVHYIATVFASPLAARKTHDAISAALHSLTDFPHRHQKITTFEKDDVRLLAFKNYGIFYITDESSKQVTVIRIMHSSQDYSAIFN